MRVAQLVNGNMELTNEQKEKIILSLKKTKNKLSPCVESLNYLSDLFREHVDKSFSLSCGRCKRNLTSFWSSQVKNKFK